MGEIRSLAQDLLNANQGKRIDKAIFDRWPIQGFFNTMAPELEI